MNRWPDRLMRIDGASAPDLTPYTLTLGAHVLHRRTRGLRHANGAAVVAVGAEPGAGFDDRRMMSDHLVIEGEPAGRQDHTQLGPDRDVLAIAAGDDPPHAAPSSSHQPQQRRTSYTTSTPRRAGLGDQRVHRRPPALALALGVVDARRVGSWRRTDDPVPRRGVLAPGEHQTAIGDVRRYPPS